MKVTFQVPSITCNHCVDKIEKFVGEIEGVSFIDASVEKRAWLWNLTLQRHRI